jgi:natural product precursor
MKKDETVKGQREESKGKSRKLVLNKETIRELSASELRHVAGGGRFTYECRLTNVC